jgi:hypothetical protein
MGRGERLLRGSDGAYPICGHQADAGAPVQDILDIQRGFVGDGELEFRARDVDALGYERGFYVGLERL